MSERRGDGSSAIAQPVTAAPRGRTAGTMYVRTALLLTSLAACSGGSAGFSPSPNLMASHEYLRGNWYGTLRDFATGATYDTRLDIEQGARADHFDAGATVSGVGNAAGHVQAGGDQWRALLSSSTFGTVQVAGAISADGYTLRGTWFAASGPVRNGSLEFTVHSVPAVLWVQEVHELADMTVILQQRRR